MATTLRRKQPVKTQINPSQIEREIRCRAYELYEQRGRLDGHDLDDWLQAEDEIIREKARAIAA